ncbi:hypothetical protein QO206_05665 [Leeuwenhoekiella aequorea]|uniref:hypothetical protein n=1 Tax=Leeuwenhoekiella aequorea TaxID=283736 RepID=UPI00352DB3E2
MSTLKIYVDTNYPRPVVQLLESIHALQKQKKFEIVRWDDGDIPENELKNSIFLVIDYQKRGLSIPTLKQAEEGYKTIVCRAKKDKLNRFELLMTILRVWPFILEKKEQLNNSTLLTFNYGGRKLIKYQNAC